MGAAGGGIVGLWGRWVAGEVEAAPREDFRRVADDEGTVCLTPRDDGSVDVDVAFDVCLSSSCDSAEAVTCGVAIGDAGIEITSHVEVVTPSREVCTADCRNVKASCGVLEPFAGERVFVHGMEASEPVAFSAGQAWQLFGDAAHCQLASYDYDRE